MGIRGVTAEQELSTPTQIRDVRRFGQRFSETLRDPELGALLFFVVGMILLVAPFWLPETVLLVEPIALIALAYLLWLSRQKVSLPIRVPKYAGILDPKSFKPGTRIARMAAGINLLGNELGTQREIWEDKDIATVHKLVLGTTGAGKTEYLKSLCCNQLCYGSGFAFVDGKADVKLWDDLSAIARRFGRDDDLLVLNLLADKNNKRSGSNTVNPIATGNANALINIIASLMGESSGDQMWRGRALALLEAVIPILVWLRDKRGMLLSFGEVREGLNLSNIVARSRDENIPPALRKGLQDYLKELPGYTDDLFDDYGAPESDDRRRQLVAGVLEQHGYLQMQFTRPLQNMSNTYGPTFEVPVPDIDMRDIILNRRMLLGMLPALKVSGDELAQLGRIIASLIGEMMGSVLGDEIEGARNEIIENRSTNAEVAFLNLNDECGYTLTDGHDKQAAQARSLNISLVFASQEINSMRGREPEIANAVLGNCKVKIFMGIEDPEATWEFIQKTVGETRVAITAGYSQNDASSMLPAYRDRRDAALEKVSRVDWFDIKAQTYGEAHLVYLDNIFRIRALNTPAKPIEHLRRGRFLQVKPPPCGLVLRSAQASTPPARKVPPPRKATEHDFAPQQEREQLSRRFQDPIWTAARVAGDVATDAGLLGAIEAFAHHMKRHKNAVQASAVAVASFIRMGDAKAELLASAFIAPADQGNAAAMPDLPVPPATSVPVAEAELIRSQGVIGDKPARPASPVTVDTIQGSERNYAAVALAIANMLTPIIVGGVKATLSSTPDTPVIEDPVEAAQRLESISATAADLMARGESIVTGASAQEAQERIEAALAAIRQPDYPGTVSVPPKTGKEVSDLLHGLSTEDTAPDGMSGRTRRG